MAYTFLKAKGYEVGTSLVDNEKIDYCKEMKMCIRDSVTAGAGWIAVALIIFSTWNPLKAIFAAYLFGMLSGLNYKMQGWEIQICLLYTSII